MTSSSRAAFLVLAALVTGMAHAAPTGSVLNLDDTEPTVDDVAAAAARARAVRCPTPACQAIEAVDQLMKIEAFEDDHEQMGTARIMYSEPLVWRWRRRVLLDRPALYPAFCAAGARLLGRVLPGTEGSTAFSATLLVAAVDIDLRSHADCVRDMVAALPRSPETDAVRVTAEDFCRSDWHARPRVACEALVKIVPTAK